MTNFIKNGDFSKQGADWVKRDNPQNVSFESDTCVITGPGSISQNFTIPDESVGPDRILKLSLRVRTLRDTTASATLYVIPIGEPIVLSIDGNQDWVTMTAEFKYSRMLFGYEFILKSLGGEGCIFDDVTISRLA